ncbi:MBL fold metallo-hydrolase [Azotobacter vinelandii]
MNAIRFFYCWLIKSDDLCVLVDTGFFLRKMAKTRNRHYHSSPEALLAELDIDAVSIKHIIVTHMHYDHIGNLPAFPNAVLYMQEKKRCTIAPEGQCIILLFVHHLIQKNISNAVLRLHIGKVRFLSAEEELFPGISIQLVGGHTDGMQIVKVNTIRGILILASDAAHFFGSTYKKNTPFPIVKKVFLKCFFCPFGVN